MGIGNRLHGKLAPLQGGGEHICPECGRDFDEHDSEIRDGKVIKLCPFCHEQIEDDKDEKSHRMK